MGLTAKERIIRAKIQLYEKAPFFSFITNHMGFVEDNKGVPTMGVNQYGTCYFNTEWVMKLSDEELEGVLCHEAMHCALEHIKRRDKRDAQMFNWATDIVVNNMISNGKMQLPKGLVPRNNQIEILSITINDIDKKTAEMIYKELQPLVDEKEKLKELLKGFDIHISEDEDNKNEVGQQGQTEGLEIETDWKQVLAEASAFAKTQGKGSADFDRLVELTLSNKVNWKTLLARYMTNEIGHNYSYSRPSKRSFSTGVYMPYIQKESMDITIAIDTSGSIRNKELSMFLGQIYNIVNSFHNIKVKVLYHDDELKKEYSFNNMNLRDIKNLKPVGGGGTSHQPIMDYVKKNRTNVLVCFTDGYSDINQVDYKFGKTIFVLTDNNCERPKYGKSILFEMED